MLLTTSTKSKHLERMSPLGWVCQVSPWTECLDWITDQSQLQHAFTNIFCNPSSVKVVKLTSSKTRQHLVFGWHRYKERNLISLKSWMGYQVIFSHSNQEAHNAGLGFVKIMQQCSAAVWLVCRVACSIHFIRVSLQIVITGLHKISIIPNTSCSTEKSHAYLSRICW